MQKILQDSETRITEMAVPSPHTKFHKSLALDK